MKTLKLFFKNVIYLLLIFTLIYLVIFLSNLKCNPETVEIIKTDTIIKVIYRDFVEYDTIIKNKYITKYDTVFVKGDTIFVEYIIGDYLASVFYSDTVQNDSSAKIIINDTIQRNRLKNRLTEIEVYNYTKTIHDKDVLNLSVGSFLFYTPTYENNISIGLCADLALKKNVFGIGYGTDKTYLFNYKRLIFEK